VTTGAASPRRFWGWGREGEGPSVDQRHAIGRVLAARFGLADVTSVEPPRLEDLDLRPPRISPPGTLAAICTSAPRERASHAYGKSFRDVVRALRRDYSHPPDVVAYPRSEAEVSAVLDWCTAVHAAAIPYGGGSSVVAGVEPAVGDAYAGAVTLDLSQLDRVLEVDRTSRAARIQAGVLGPALEDQLRPHGLTLRHFPQSFEFSSLGGWIATRSGGHYATLYTHIDDFVEALRVVTPRGTVETRRLPGSGAGPSPDRLFIGSEGILGVITEAWMRLQDRPTFRASAPVTFATFEAGVEAARALAQSGLHPSNCRLLDPGEAATAGAGSGSEAVLLVAFESADHSLDAWMARALECVADHGARIPPDAGRTRAAESGAREGAAGAWRQSFLGAPYLRDALVAMGMISETFETAVTWDRFPAFHAGVVAATEEALRAACGAGQVTCRFTHVYADGPAPYYTVIAPGRRGAELEQWAAIKAAASDAILRLGGTITHHHAVGRDHRPWYDRERPDAFAAALVAAKAALDPAGILNPGVLVDPAGR
jgi:alkyldihydroxyacetonephosphate synthase